MDRIEILPHFEGIAMHDHWSSYLTYEQCDHAFCNSHHLRELKLAHEEYDQPWAEKMQVLLLDIKQAVDTVIDTVVEDTETQATSLAATALVDFGTRYDEILAQGFAANPSPTQPHSGRGRPKQSKPKNLFNKIVAVEAHSTRQLTCPVCQQLFTQETVGRTGRYCTAACKQKAYRQRRDKAMRRQYGPRFS